MNSEIKKNPAAVSKVDLTPDMKPCRLDSDPCFGRGLWYCGQHYCIDRDASFAQAKGLPRIARTYSPAGQIFDIYRGVAQSVIGSTQEFACAVRVGQVQ